MLQRIGPAVARGTGAWPRPPLRHRRFGPEVPRPLVNHRPRLGSAQRGQRKRVKYERTHIRVYTRDTGVILLSNQCFNLTERYLA